MGLKYSLIYIEFLFMILQSKVCVVRNWSSQFASMCECVWVRQKEREREHVLLNVPTLCNADPSERSMERRK